MSKLLWYDFGFWLLTGLFSGIAKLTGISIDPTSLMLLVANTINAANPDKQVAGSLTSSLAIISIGITLVTVVIAIVVTYQAFKKYRYLALIMAALGFFSFFLLIVINGTWVKLLGIAFLIIGAFICNSLEGNAPKDFVSKWS